MIAHAIPRTPSGQSVRILLAEIDRRCWATRTYPYHAGNASAIHATYAMAGEGIWIDLEVACGLRFTGMPVRQAVLAVLRARCEK